MTTDAEEERLRAEMLEKVSRGNPLLDEAAFRRVLEGCKTAEERAYLTRLFKMTQEFVHNPKNDWDEILGDSEGTETSGSEAE